MVGPERFELPAHRFVACCSIQLSYEPTQGDKLFLFGKKSKESFRYPALTAFTARARRAILREA